MNKGRRKLFKKLAGLASAAAVSTKLDGKSYKASAYTCCAECGKEMKVVESTSTHTFLVCSVCNIERVELDMEGVRVRLNALEHAASAVVDIIDRRVIGPARTVGISKLNEYS